MVPFPRPLRRIENLPLIIAKHPVNGGRAGQRSAEAMPRKRARVLANEHDVKAGVGHPDGEAGDVHSPTADNTQEKRANVAATDKLVGVDLPDVATFES